MFLHSLRDRIFNTNVSHVTNVTMKALNLIQDYPVDEQIMSIGVLFQCLIRRYNVATASEVLNGVDNMMKRATGVYDQATFRAVEAYLKNEWETKNNGIEVGKK